MHEIVVKGTRRARRRTRRRASWSRWRWRCIGAPSISEEYTLRARWKSQNDAKLESFINRGMQLHVRQTGLKLFPKLLTVQLLFRANSLKLIYQASRFTQHVCVVVNVIALDTRKYERRLRNQAKNRPPIDATIELKERSKILLQTRVYVLVDELHETNDSTRLWKASISCRSTFTGMHEAPRNLNTFSPPPTRIRHKKFHLIPRMIFKRSKRSPTTKVSRCQFFRHKYCSHDCVFIDNLVPIPSFSTSDLLGLYGFVSDQWNFFFLLEYSVFIASYRW